MKHPQNGDINFVSFISTQYTCPKFEDNTDVKDNTINVLATCPVNKSK